MWPYIYLFKFNLERDVGSFPKSPDRQINHIGIGLRQLYVSFQLPDIKIIMRSLRDTSVVSNDADLEIHNGLFNIK